MIKKLNNDLIIGIFLLIFEGILWTVNTQAPEKAGYYPRYLLICAIVLTLLLVIKSLKGSKVTQDEQSVLNKNYLHIAVLIALTVVYLFFLPYLGYIISTVFYVLSLMLYLGMRNKAYLFVTPLLTTIVLYFVFNKFLLIKLPECIFF
ncbi:MAG: tripartite tricarboxylate transporter TctB family protein [Peptococcaceae bacterium]